MILDWLLQSAQHQSATGISVAPAASAASDPHKLQKKQQPGAGRIHLTISNAFKIPILARFPNEA